MITWGQASPGQKAFTIVTAVLVIVGFNVGMFISFGTEPWWAHVVHAGVDALIVGLVVKVAVWG